jgi:periplasmic copper chaperone A
MKHILLAFLLTTTAFAHDYNHGDLHIHHPFTRQPPEGAKVAGGFLTITNKGAIADRLISASSNFASKTEIHEMAHEGGVMKMRELTKGLEIKPNDTLSLKPGGYHVMFMGLNQTLKAGEKHKATLVFEKTGSVEVEFNVEAMGGGHSHHAH